ncbi:MAG TPA: hypothetical protein VHO67_21800 [Polyangia bacterium]|nr:hypothetical protein [Polyangia bacterium]
MHVSPRAFAVTLLSLSIAMAAGCGFKPSAKNPVGSGGQTGASAGGAGQGAGGSTLGIGARDAGVPDVPSVTACNPCSDFPAAPILDAPAGATPPPAAVADAFGAAGTGAASGGPCLLDPEAGSLFPRNWLRPRFHLQPGSHQDVFEIRLHADKEANDLVVYTTSPTWTMPAAIWSGLSANVVDQPITVSVRGLDSSTGKVAQGVTQTITIAPVEAKGTIVYWTTSGGSALKGFSVGQENVVTVVTPPQTPGKCIGCHSSSPGGEFIGFSNSSDATNGDLAHIEIRSGTNPTQQPSFLTPAAQALLQRVSQELPVFSPAHWTTGDHVAVFMHSDSTDESAQNTHLLWVDLEAASQAQGVGWGEFARTGDPNPAAAYPFISHDGQHIVYSSAPSANPSGILDSGDLYMVDYGNRAGGKAQPVAGAATKQWSEFYPALSPDDAIIAYTRLPDGESSYDNAKSEIMLVDAKGGTPVRPVANDPGTCQGHASPGVTNSWPKWSPVASTASGRTYYWIIFSSTRSGNPQLYIAGVIRDEVGQVTTTPALYLWNQPPAENNHTPAWDTFLIPLG